MSRLQPADAALRLTTILPRQPYVCRTCRAHSARQFHASAPSAAAKPWFQRMRENVFGDSEAREKQAKRERAAEREESTSVDESASVHEGKRKERELKRKGGYTFAEVVEKKNNPKYSRAEDWKGLERVGGEEWVKKQKDTGEKYVGFQSGDRVKLRPDQWKNLLHHVAVEVFALREAGRDVAAVCHRRVGQETFSKTREVRIELGEGGTGVSLKPAGLTEQILKSIPSSPKEAPNQYERGDRWLAHQRKGAIGRAGAARIMAAKDEEWMAAPMPDPALKFAILKHATQLSGQRPYDAAITSATTVRDAYKAFVRSEKPKKLAKTAPLISLKGTPNVAVHDKRQTPITKEKRIGRWKIIEEELKKRDLPVTGRRFVNAKTNLVQ